MTRHWQLPVNIKRYALLNGTLKLIKAKPTIKAKKYGVNISLSEADYLRAKAEAKVTKQSVAAWTADMVCTSTQP